MDLAWAYAQYLPLIEAEMRGLLVPDDAHFGAHYGMMQYHMGWVDASFNPVSAPSGKRIRPLLCLLACAAAGGDPQQALPAAAGLELLHNFSLIHDDIEDNSSNRRHRPTLWTLFGVPQACNAGDGMFSVAHLAFQRLRRLGVADRIVLDALLLFDRTCLSLTEGQHLDMAFEKREQVSPAAYYQMIACKTGALLAASPEMGALIACASAEQVEAYRRFGGALGRAFQLQDDLLGIWGDEAVTGKSAASDILGRKKSLPIILALAHPEIGPRLVELYAGPPFGATEVSEILGLLEASGARILVEEQVRIAEEEAQSALASLLPNAEREFLMILAELQHSLVARAR